MKYNYNDLNKLSVLLTTVVVRASKLLLSNGLSLTQHSKKFVKLLPRRLKRGRQGLKEFKEICFFLTKSVLGCKKNKRPNCKLPRSVWTLRRKAKNSFQKSYFVIVVCQCHRIVMFPPEYDVKTITSPFEGSFLGIIKEI
jgi:hypothetical protein